MSKDMYEKRVNKFIDKFISQNKNDLHNTFDVDDLLYLIKEFGDDYYDVSEKKQNKLTHQIIKHSFRVLNNLRTILLFLKDKGYKFNIDELNNMTIGAVLHDVGKVMCESDKKLKDAPHNLIGYLMIKRLFKYDNKLSNYDKCVILEMIKMHSDKRKDRDKITIYTKLLRDADLFDEICGDSLYDLLRDLTICVNINLNTYEYDGIPELIKESKSDSTIQKIVKRINVKENRKLLYRELKKAEAKYNEYFFRPKCNTTLNDIYDEDDVKLSINIEI